MGTTLVELCAGTASVSLWALDRGAPLVGYMGSKRRWASTLCHVLDVEREVPERVVLVDQGPWGDVWKVLKWKEHREAVCALLREWNAEDPHDLWERLVRIPPPTADHRWRIAQYLWLQARSAGTIPIWWSAETARWESPTGSRTENAHARGGSGAAGRGKGSRSTRDTRGGAAAQKGTRGDGPAYEAGSFARKRTIEPSQVDSTRGPIEPGKRWRAGCRGIQYPETIARRIEALEGLPWHRVTVIHGDLRLVEPIPGSTVYFDPPYVGCPRYAALLPSLDVPVVASRHAAAGCRVLVSEARALDLEGWRSSRLPSGRTFAGGGGRGKPEWITGSWPFAVEEQLDLGLSLSRVA